MSSLRQRFKIVAAIPIACFLVSCQHTSNKNDTPAASDASTPLFDTMPAHTCGDHLVAGDPGTSDQLLCREGFAVGYNYQYKVANWVAYHVTASSVSARYDRNDNFREDAEVTVGSRATLSDYSGSGYDRGHLAPAATVDFSYNAMDESFLLSNIAPQLPDFNRNGWADLEQYVRDCTVEKGELYVITGPIFTSASVPTIGNGVAVPDAYYKVILNPTPPVSAFALKIPHQALAAEEIGNYITSIDQVEAATGFDFLASVTDEIENSIERDTTPVCTLPWGQSQGTGGTTYSCDIAKNCSDMSSCDEAYYYLNTCGKSSLDADKDGVPCESLCN